MQKLHCTVLTAIALLAAGSSGCSTMDNTTKGAGIGGALGAGTGLAIGAATGNPRTGAAVGGLLGAGVGAAVGNDKDNQIAQQRRDIQYANAVASSNAQRLGMTDVIHMAQQGQEEQIIINQIHTTGSTFQLSVSDLETLKQNNVSPRVIAEMQNARPTAVVVPPPRPTVIYDAPPPPVVVVGPPRPYYYGGWGYRYRGW